VTSKFFAGRPSGRPTASVRLGRAADAALDQLVLDELGAEPSLPALPLAPARASRFGRSARTAVIEQLEDRRLMAGELTQAEYNNEARAIDDWAKRRRAKEADPSLPLVFPPGWKRVDGEGRTIAIIGVGVPPKEAE